jgi:hypothetical protein
MQNRTKLLPPSIDLVMQNSKIKFTPAIFLQNIFQKNFFLLEMQGGAMGEMAYS